jgi:ankyrin repeat protein
MNCETPLISAIQNRDTAAAIKIISSGTDLNVKDCNGTTALIETIVLDEFEIAENIVLGGANTNMPDGSLASPLAISSGYCRERFVTLLLRHGAEVNSVDVHGYSPLMNSVYICQDGKMAALLLSRGAKVNLVAKNGETALTTAAFAGNEHAVHVLVAAGANLAAKTKDGETALTIARDRDVGRKEAHDRIYNFLLQVFLLMGKP